MNGYGMPAETTAELRALEEQITPIEEVLDPVDHRRSCACGDFTVPEDFGSVTDPVDDRFLHSPGLCFLLDDELDR